MIELLFTTAFSVVAGCILFAAVAPWLPDSLVALIKPVWGFVQRHIKPLAIAVAAVVAFVFASRASLQRRKQSKELGKSRELQDSHLSKAEVHRAEAKAAAAKADAILARGRHNVEKVTDEISTDQRVNRINQRLRDAARASKRSQ